MNFPSPPKACSSSAGVLRKDRDKDSPDRDRDFNDARNPPPAAGQKWSVSATTATKLVPTFTRVLSQ